jgi:uncharacterized protein (TIGR00299 family) protein
LPEGQPLRHLADLLRLLAEAHLPSGVANGAERVLRELAAAEAAVHGVDVADVHFHEIGALDTLFDVTGVVAGLAALHVERLTVGPLNVGGGTVRMAHGLLPVPPPAVARLTRELLTYGTPEAGELLTPTGAALLATLGTPLAAQPLLRITAAGYGAGQKQLPQANVVRLILGEPAEIGLPPTTVGRAADSFPSDETVGVGSEAALPSSPDHLLLLSCNIDDMNPEFSGYCTERLFSDGALDVWLTPIIMKKGRPAVQISVLASAAAAPKLRETLFRETTTLGVRTIALQRDRLERRWERVETLYGSIRVKVGLLGDDAVNRAPEYEDCAAAAREHAVPLKQVYAAALNAGPR